MIGVDSSSFLVIVAVAAVAGLVVTALGPRLVIPVVVVEIVLGILVGPQVAASRSWTRPRSSSGTSAWGCCSSSPATRSTSSGSRGSR